MSVENLITQHIDIWTSAVQTKSAAGRGTSSKLDLYGIKKLRELILELAVRGKLVPQDPNDEPASVLFDRVINQQDELVKANKIKKQKKLPEVSKDEVTYELPDGWVWCRLGSLFNSIISGGTPSKRNSEFWGGDIPWASVKDLGKSLILSETQDYITEKGLIAGSKLANIGDLLICTRMGLGKIGVVSVPMAFNQDLKAVSLNEYISTQFFLNYYATIKIKGTGTTVAGITQDQLLNYVFALPPEKEQHRIVAKVDELMALCNQLEQQTEASIAAHQVLVETLLATLTNSKNAEELMENWQRISAYFDTLFTTEESIDQLKQTILQLAVMGKLVPQNPADEPASELLKRIAKEKAQLVKDKKIKKQKALPPITDDEKPFELPEGWEWCRLGNLINLISGQHLKPTEYSETPLANGNPYITGPAEFGPVYPSFSKYTNEKRALAAVGDILITCKGAGLGKLNKTNQTLAISRQLMAIQSICVDREFVYTVVSSKYDYFQSKGVGIAIPGISREDVTDLIVALPPVNEQSRIIARLSELLIICDQLKQRLCDSQRTQLQLTDAILEQAI